MYFQLPSDHTPDVMGVLPVGHNSCSFFVKICTICDIVVYFRVASIFLKKY